MDFCFKGARQKIENVIQNYINCIFVERKMEKGEGSLHPISKEERPFDTYHIENLGPLANKKRIPLSFHSNKCIHKVHLAVSNKINRNIGDD